MGSEFNVSLAVVNRTSEHSFQKQKNFQIYEGLCLVRSIRLRLRVFEKIEFCVKKRNIISELSSVKYMCDRDQVQKLLSEIIIFKRFCETCNLFCTSHKVEGTSSLILDDFFFECTSNCSRYDIARIVLNRYYFAMLNTIKSLVI